jgi:hypothetical protein
VLERISTRITNEVREVNRVVAGPDEQAAGHHRVGMRPTISVSAGVVLDGRGPGSSGA